MSVAGGRLNVIVHVGHTSQRDAMALAMASLALTPGATVELEVTGDDRMMRELAEGRPLPPRS